MLTVAQTTQRVKVKMFVCLPVYTHVYAGLAWCSPYLRIACSQKLFDPGQAGAWSNLDVACLQRRDFTSLCGSGLALLPGFSGEKGRSEAGNWM